MFAAQVFLFSSQNPFLVLQQKSSNNYKPVQPRWLNFKDRGWWSFSALLLLSKMSANGLVRYQVKSF